MESDSTGTTSISSDLKGFRTDTSPQIFLPGGLDDRAPDSSLESVSNSNSARSPDKDKDSNKSSIPSQPEESSKDKRDNSMGTITRNTDVFKLLEESKNHLGKWPKHVYEAYDNAMHKSTWEEIRPLGRGAFSQVILACPKDRYLKTEFQGRAQDFKVAIKIVDISEKRSKERMEGGLKREIEILKV